MSDDIDAFVRQFQAVRDQLLTELHSYHPRGVMRLWAGRTFGSREITAERVSQIEQEIARIDWAIEFVSALGKML